MSDSDNCDKVVVERVGRQPLKQLNRIAKRPPINIEFQDLHYSVRDSHKKGGWRQLLKSVSGKFRSGEMTAIMGPSGAGKSTLLNILAGYVAAGVKGSIKINDRPREMKIFNKLSTYIMQEDIVQPRLTVREAMTVAANLKLGSEIGKDEKVAVIDEVINLLGLEGCNDTRTEYLSGGQRKRLGIALELVNNPPVIFLDEPTTGLDNVAINQCMELLHKITRLGRTVICTIHQPAASLFQTFDQVYVLADGYCAYNGSPADLVPFLSNTGFSCPTYHTPCDYIIEVIQLCPDSIKILTSTIQNGKVNMNNAITDKSPSTIPDVTFDDCLEIYRDTTQTAVVLQDVIFPTTIWQQFCILLRRMFLQMSRNKTMLYIQFFHHLLSGLLIGGIFFGTGNDASQTISIFKYCVSVNVFFMYTHVMAPVLLFPLEVKLLRREYFNRWYGLKAYYMALTVSTLPLLIILGIMFLVIVYFITDQPMDPVRFFWFSAMGLSIAVCSQGLGYAIGTVFNITKGSIVGPSVLAPLLALAVYGMGYKTSIEPFMKVLMAMSYLRYGVVGFCNSLFYKREPLDCNEIYCHYRHPEVLMADMGMENQSQTTQVLVILGFMLLFRVFSYLALKYRMTSEFSNKIVYYATKIIRQKD